MLLQLLLPILLFAETTRPDKFKERFTYGLVQSELDCIRQGATQKARTEQRAIMAEYRAQLAAHKASKSTKPKPRVGELQYLGVMDQEKSKKMVAALAPYLDQSFNYFRMNALDRALFYSQALYESQGFASVTESSNYSTRGVGAATSEASLGLAQLVRDTTLAPIGDAHRSHQIPEFRGRGPLQVTGCHNYMSALHFINQMADGKPNPRWQTYWQYTQVVGKKKIEVEISDSCTPEQRQRMQETYQKRFGRPMDPYKMLDNTSRFAMVHGELADGKGNKVPSERMMVNVSMAYWKGVCGGLSRGVNNLQQLLQTSECSAYKQGEEIMRASQCATKCIRRSTDETYDKRAEWLRIALQCVK